MSCRKITYAATAPKTKSTRSSKIPSSSMPVGNIFGRRSGPANWIPGRGASDLSLVLTVARLMGGMSAIQPHRALDRPSEQEAVGTERVRAQWSRDRGAGGKRLPRAVHGLPEDGIDAQDARSSA